MKRPLLLDLFSGAGGCSMGYHRAGFDVVGVDIKPQPRYPFTFVQADALEIMDALLDGHDVADSKGGEWHARDFAAFHASPPCQKYTVAQNAAKNAHAHPDLVAPVRELLQSMGKPYVIENVVGAPLINPVVLCGLSFGLQVRRHRLFESNFFVMSRPCQCKGQDYYVIFGHEVRNRRHGSSVQRKNSIADGRKAMGIEWMTRAELSQAIPPAYCEFIGRHLMRHLDLATEAL